MNKFLVLLSFVFVLCTGCASYSYFQSPMHANTNLYKSIPLHSDSVKSATYVGAAFSLGGANDDLSDNLLDFSATIHQAHNFGMFQAYYGITGALGSYQVDNSFTYNGSKSFSFWETSGGMNVVVPFGAGEWRLGGELSYSQEYGDYLAFRKSIPEGTANLNDTRQYHFTLGGYSDLLFKLRKNVIGFKLSPGFNLNYIQGYNDNQLDYRRRTYYFIHTSHFQKNRLTCFIQEQFGTYTFMVQTGVSVRVGR